MSGFLFNELSEFKQNLIKEVQEKFPKEYEKFLKNEAKTIKKTAQKIARKEVKKGDLHTRYDKKKQREVSTNYHKNFKIGKNYTFGGNVCIRVFNSARHAHLIENGHVLYSHGKPVGFVLGSLVFKLTEMESKTQFLDDAEKFLYEYFDKTTER
jgi:hypothetical protein